MANYKRRQVMLSDEDREIAKVMGDGNISLGLRKIILVFESARKAEWRKEQVKNYGKDHPWVQSIHTAKPDVPLDDDDIEF